jgi:small subunit ribosomal protein S4
MGFASSRNEARQLVGHGHILVNGKKASIPSQLVKTNDEVSVKAKSRTNVHVIAALEAARRKGTTSWVQVDPANFTGKILSDPKREELTLPMQEQLIVEMYSR